MSHKRKNKKGNQINIISEYPIETLYKKYKNHHRLKVFVNKGTKCVACHCEGKRLIKHRNLHKNGTYEDHIDLYTKDLVLMTVDHMLPKCKKGSNKLSNKQTMCTNCNNEKSGKYYPILGRFRWFYRVRYLIKKWVREW